MSLFGRLFGKDKVRNGDIVVCIDDREWNGDTNIELIFNKKYKVLTVIKHCCHVSYDIGGRFNRSTSFTACSKCLKQIQGQGIHWANSRRFRKATPEEASEFYKGQEADIKEQIKEAVSVENYELASVLTKELEEHV